MGIESHYPHEGWLSVRLSEDDLRLGYRCGVARYNKQRSGGNYDAAFRKGRGARNDIEGALGEIAFWRLCDREPPPEMVLSMPEWARQRGPNGGLLTDVLGVEIRATVHKTGGIYIHKDSARDLAKYETAFVLAIVDWLPYYPEEGFTTGSQTIDAMLGKNLEKDLQVYQRDVVFRGWCRGREVRDEHWYEAGPHPEYRVPQEELHRMEELAPGLFAPPVDFFTPMAKSIHATTDITKDQRREAKEVFFRTLLAINVHPHTMTEADIDALVDGTLDLFPEAGSDVRPGVRTVVGEWASWIRTQTIEWSPGHEGLMSAV